MAGRLAFFGGEHTEEALLIGWICLLAHSLFLPLLALVPALGYLIAVVRATLTERPRLPPVSLRASLSEGFAASSICLLYGLVPLSVGAITITLATETTIDPAGGASILFLTGSTVTLFIVLAGLYFLPIALCRYSTEGLREALPDPSLVRAGTHAAYFVGWTSALVLFGVGWFAGGVIELLPLAGPVLAPLVWWCVALGATRRVAGAYGVTR
ncbi:MAG: DUF4013 domain-containing protein [Halalkalicoccus sp.]